MSIAAGSSATAQHQGRGRFREEALPWLFLVPILLLNFIVVVGPSLTSIYYSLTEWSGLGSPTFVGVANYARMLGDRNVWLAFKNNLLWTGLNLTLAIGLGLLGATLLASVKRFTLIFRAGFFLPYVLASVVNASIWLQIYNPIRGVLPFLATTLNMPFINLKPLGSPDLVLFAIYIANLWHWWGFLVVLYLAAMQGIDAELYEAALMEGANRWDQFRAITVPGIRPILVYSAVQTIIWSFKSFDYVYLMTRGGPGHASELLATLSWSFAFEEFEVGYAASIGLLLSFIALIVAIGFVALRRRGWDI
jgi:raffinose/stachyose/melibiose transport system permease protein